jgi:hypothetical protein
MLQPQRELIIPEEAAVALDMAVPPEFLLQAAQVSSSSSAINKVRHE